MAKRWDGLKCTKRTYTSKASAKKAIEAMKTRGHHGLHPYRCDWGCGRATWHIGIPTGADRERIKNGDAPSDESDKEFDEGLTTDLELPKELS